MAAACRIDHRWRIAAIHDRDEGVRFPIARRDALKAAWQGSRLRDVEVDAIEVPLDFVDFEDYWSPFLTGVAPAPGYAVSLPPPP